MAIIGSLLRTTSIVLVAVLAILLAIPPRSLDETHIETITRNFSGNRDPHQQPLDNVTILVTGATSGIGLSLTRKLSQLGATVLAVGRSQSKLQRLQQELPTVQPVPMDLADLQSVARAAQALYNTTDRIDILVNNAGMHGMMNLFHPATSNGYDQVFVVNYLSHFLLTEAIAPLLQRAERGPIIAQTSSSYHWAVDGSDLLPVNGQPPIAAQPGGSPGYYMFRTQRSYANSKLAQILHARALPMRSVSFCPGWVATHIAGATPFSYLLRLLAFVSDDWGIASGLEAIFGDADYYINSRLFLLAGVIFPRRTPRWMYVYGIRDVLGTLFAWLGLTIQRLAPAAMPTRSSPESYDAELIQEFYAWSKAAVQEYL